MSTRYSIVCKKHWHLYKEMVDNSIHLETWNRRFELDVKLWKDGNKVGWFGREIINYLYRKDQPNRVWFTKGGSK